MEPSAPFIETLWEITGAGSNLSKKVDKDLYSLIAPSFEELDRLEKESLKFSEVQLYLAVKRYKIKVTTLKGEFTKTSINESGLDLGNISELYRMNDPRLIFLEEKIKRFSDFLLWWKIFHEKYLGMIENNPVTKNNEKSSTRPVFIKKFNDNGLKFVNSENFNCLNICLNAEIFNAKCEIDMFSSKIVKSFDIQGETPFEIYNKALKKLVCLIRDNRIKSLKPRLGEYGLYLTKSDADSRDSLENAFYDHIEDVVPVL